MEGFSLLKECHLKFVTTENNKSSFLTANNDKLTYIR